MADDAAENGELAIAIIVARAQEDVARRLVRGAEEALKRHGVEEPDVYWVPAALDIPVVALALSEKGEHDAIVTLGSVVDDDIIVMQVAAGLMHVQLDTGVPISVGVLGVADEDESLARSGAKNNAGAEAAEGAVEMANLLRRIQG